MKNRTKKITAAALLTAFMCVCAMISIPAPIPFTLQTFAIFFSIMVCGVKLSALSLTCYIFIGLLGLPVFSNFSGGVGAFFSPTGGFIVGFYFLIFAFTIIKHPFIAGLFGLILCYICGAFWYAFFTGTESVGTVMTVCVLPFVLPDILKLYLANFISKRFDLGDLL